MRVGLITTGYTEWLGLPGALGALFPGHEFIAVDDVPGRPFHGFTSSPVPAPRIPGLPTAVDKLVARAVSLVDVASGNALDLVLMLEDLELANKAQPTAVCDEVRSAVARHMAGLNRDPVSHAALVQAVRAKLSFHLAVPMIESWFFGAPTALTALGVGSTPYHLRPGDPEDFESTDAAYIAAVAGACTQWSARRCPKSDAPKWVRAGTDRVFHPKGYLQWLMIDPAHKTCTSYREGRYGAAPVLATIDWARLLGNATHMTFARSLVEDLADGLGQQPVVTPWAGTASPLTNRKAPTGGAQLVLRNL